MKELVKHKSTKTIKGFKKKDGSGTYDARLVINDEWKVRLSFDNLNEDDDKSPSKVASETKEPRKAKEVKPAKEDKPKAPKAKVSKPKD
jgi:hypothetical protein